MALKDLDELLGGRKQFGLYQVLGEGEYNGKARKARCRCACGVITDVEVPRLLSGRSTRCRDCARENPARVTNEKHGQHDTPEYRAWTAMRYRCRNPNCWNYDDYGGRGICICDRWNDFEAFYQDMGPRPAGHSLDRIDNDGDYSPENCRWATNETQQSNRRVSRKVVWQGKERPISRLERQAGLPRGVLSLRLDMERAMSEPSANKKPRHEVFGEQLTTKEVCDRFGIDRQAFNRRLRRGWTAEQTVEHYST